MRVLVILLTVAMALACGAARAADANCDGMLMPAVAFKRVVRGISPDHPGIDLAAPMGTPVRAAAFGVITFVGEDGGYGIMVEIRHPSGIITRYAHLSEFTPGLFPGMRVRIGEEIGRIGSTGHSTGPHLHFEVRIDGAPVDPAPWIGVVGCAGRPPREIEEAHAPAVPPMLQPAVHLGGPRLFQ